MEVSAPMALGSGGAMSVGVGFLSGGRRMRMANDNSPHPLDRAVLSSADGRYLLELVFVSLLAECHSDWHGYELHMKQAGGGKCWSLVSTDGRMLFLENKYEPEVPVICSGLRLAARDGKAFHFTPIDEREFVLEVIADLGGLLVSVQFDDNPAPDEFGWPQGVLVSRESACRFADELEAAYARPTSWTRSIEGE